MMKTVFFTFLLFCAFIGNQLFAQNGSKFLVLLSKGKNTLNNETELKVGQELTFSDQDSIGVDDELILRQVETGNVAFFTESKNYTISEITNALAEEQEQYGFKGIYYFFGGHLLQGYDFRRKLGDDRILGSVSASIPGRIDASFELIYDNENFFRNSYKVFDNENIRITWETEKIEESYVLEFRNIFDEVIEQYEVDTLYHDFALTEKYKETDDFFAIAILYLSGQEKYKNHTELIIMKVCEEVYEEIYSDYHKIFSSPIESPEEKIKEVLFFEMRALYPDAARCLAEAIHLSQTDEERKIYAKLYDSFLHQYFPLIRDNFKENYTQIEWLECN